MINKHERPVFFGNSRISRISNKLIKIIGINRNDERKTFQVCKHISKQFIGSDDCHDRTVFDLRLP